MQSNKVPSHAATEQICQLRCAPRLRRRIGAGAIAAFVLTCLVGPATAAEVSRTVTIDAEAAAVWQDIGPYCTISDWYPGLESCSEEKIDGVIHRRLKAADGAEFLEKQLAHDNGAMRYSYAIIEGPLPVKDYEATLSVSESDGMTLVTWSSHFAPNGVSETEAADIIGGIYDTGLTSIKQRFMP